MTVYEKCTIGCIGWQRRKPGPIWGMDGGREMKGNVITVRKATRNSEREVKQRNREE